MFTGISIANPFHNTSYTSLLSFTIYLLIMIHISEVSKAQLQALCITCTQNALRKGKEFGTKAVVHIYKVV